jgi:hypothetical protein
MKLAVEFFLPKLPGGSAPLANGEEIARAISTGN